MTVSHFCPSCTQTVYEQPLDGETFYQTKARLRAAMGSQCSRSADTAKRCPMREASERAPSPLLEKV